MSQKEQIRKRIKEKVHSLPGLPGVYKMFDQYGNIIYIGKAKNLKNRVSSYFLNTEKLPKVQKMVENVFDFEYIITLSEVEALNLESNLIHKHQPFFNILLKDGKAFPYIRIDYKSDFPSVQITRRIRKDGAMYFGPYINKISITELYGIINNTFKLRDCNLNMNKKIGRECLNYQIHNCLAPCTGRCTKEEYRKEVDRVISFLKGNLNEAEEIISSKMRTYSQMELFEKAIEMRDSLKKIQQIGAQNVTGLNKEMDIDIFGFAENGETSVVSFACVRGSKMVGLTNFNIIDASNNSSDIIFNFITQYYMQNKIVPSMVVSVGGDEVLQTWLTEFSGHKVVVSQGKREPYSRLLDMANKNASEYLNKSIEKNKLHELRTIGAVKTLQKTMGLKKLPLRIEGYDISNLGGTNTVASMVVFTNGEKDAKMYRKFKILENGQNDFRNMHDVLARRLNEYKSGKDLSFSQLPDLILIDGGPVQLEFAHNALLEQGIDIEMISLAERNEEIYTLDGNKVVLSRDNFALKLLQNVRDESHRFAITFQKSLRQKKALRSELENVPLIGKNKVNILFDRFKSIDAIKVASIEELKSINGIGEKLARNIWEYFHKD
ncbi:MAG: excinuclease ABC subunit UvrC [Clostridia bacterium]|nr:excinuclease ABC subunit UvrC [Clostridia bacterium]